MAYKKVAIILILIIAIAVIFTACSIEDDGIAVNFMIGDDLYVSLEVSGDSAVEFPNDPTLEGYGFMGWYLDKEYNESFDSSTIITETITLYAKFEANVQYSVKFVDSDGTTLRSAMVTCWVVPTVPTVSDKVSDEVTYKFIGWDSEVVAATEDVVYTAQYEKVTNTYTLTFDTMGGSCDTTTITVDYGTVVSLDAEATKEGYNFYGWTLNDEVVEEVEITADTTVYATWKATYTVWFMGYNNVLLSRDILEEGDMPTVPDVDDVKLYEYTYTFVGWDKVVTSVTADTTYTAQFYKETNNYTLTYDLTDGTFTDDTALETSYAYGTEVTLSTAVEREGYLFIGWVLGSETVETVTVTSNISVEAQWVKVYTIVFSYMNSDYTKEEVSEQTIVENAMPEAPTVENSSTAYAVYTFSHWEVEGISSAVSVATADVTYKAVYDETPLTYSVTYYANGGAFDDDSIIISTTENKGSTINLDTILQNNSLTREGYTFIGWATTATSTITVSDTQTITADATFYAVWQDNSEITYTITFYDGNGNEIEVLEVLPGTTPTAPVVADNIQIGDTIYTFVGWSSDIVPASEDASYTAMYE